MNAQRLLKILALISIAATLAAVIEWRELQQPPSPLLVQISVIAFAGALVAGLIGQETRPRIMLRFLAAVCALVAVIAFVTDYSRPASGFSSLAGHLALLAPSLLANFKATVTHAAGPSAWTVVAKALAVPTYIAFALLAALCGFASRPRQRLSVYVN